MSLIWPQFNSKGQLCTKMLSVIKLLYILLHYTFALKIYKSQLELGENRAISGLHYEKTNNGNLVLSNSLTCCIRINFKRLSRSHTARILTIGNSKSTDEYPNFLRDHP